MSSSSFWSRRQFLKNMGLASLSASGFSLPLFSHLPQGWSQNMGNPSDAPIPTRLILFYTPNGTKKELWRPSHDPGPLSQVGSLLTPLDPYKDRLILLDGVDSKAAQEGPGGPHQRGMASLFTGQVITEGDFVGGDGRKAGWGGGISVDQAIAQQIGNDTPFRSLELGIRVRENMPRGRICYAGSEQPLPPENDPVQVYERLFAQMGENPQLVARRLRRRSSVLDFVMDDFKKLEPHLDRADREKLQQHAQNVRELERRLSLVASPSTRCQPSPIQGFDDILREDYFGQIAQHQVDLLVNAFACDQTRVGSIQCSTAVNALRLNFLDPMIAQEGHSLSHAGDTNQGMQTEWERNLTWHSELFAYLLQQLDSIPEGEGTLLDHTVIVWASEISRGNTHDLNDIPFVIAGGGSGRLNAGQYLRYEGVAHNRLLLSLMEVFDVNWSQFGADHYRVDGPLSELLI